MLRVKAALIALALVAAACGGGDDDTDDATDETTSSASASASTVADDDEDDDGTTTTVVVDDGPTAPFTGVPAADDLAAEPAVVIKISNNDDRSLEGLIGLERADVVIEERIEDRATRFAAIFHSEMPDLVGPIRSARTTDLDLLTNLGKPILIFSGANLFVLGELRDLAADGGAVLVVDDGSGEPLFRDTDFRAPDNLFVDAATVRETVRDDAGTPEPIFSFRGSQSDTRPASVDGSGVSVTGRDAVAFVHDPARGYVRVQDGAVHVTREGDPLVVTNVVVMETRYVANANDPESVDAITTGEGAASVLIGGRRFIGTWSRETADDPYTFSTEEGAEILLEPGRTWMTLVPADTYEFAVDSETQRLVTGGDE